MLKILHINSNYLHTPLYSEVIQRLENKGIKNTIIMPRKQNDDKHLNKNLIQHEAQIIHKQILNKYDRFRYFHKQKKITKWIEETRVNICDYDLLHAHTLFSDGYYAYKSGKPYLVTVRNTDLNYYFKYYPHLFLLGKKILSNASKIIFLSETYKKETIDKIYKDTLNKKKLLNKSVIIPNGINDFWIKNQMTYKKNLDKKINVLFVGRIMKNKNIIFMIENLKKLSIPRDVYFHIVGEVIDKNYYNKIRKYKNVKFHGKLNREEIRNLMDEMHLFTMVSHNETFGLVYLEALTQSLPVLYTAHQGFDNYYKDGYVGYPVNSKNNFDFQQKFKYIISNYNEIQNNINKINKFEYGWESNVNKHIEIYKEALYKKNFEDNIF